MFEKMEQFLEKQYEMAIKADFATDKKVFFDQAFGGLSFAIQMCGEDWDETNRYAALWIVWYPRFVKLVYGYDVEG